MAAGNVVGGSLPIASGWQLVLATFKNLPAERVPSVCSQSRYIADIFIKDIFFSRSRYIADILSLHTVQNILRLEKAFRSHVVSVEVG